MSDAIKKKERIDWYLAQLAGENVDMTTLTPVNPVNNMEKYLLKISDRLDDMEESAEKQMNAMADVAEAPTKTDFNALLAALRAAGFMKSSS